MKQFNKFGFRLLKSWCRCGRWHQEKRGVGPVACPCGRGPMTTTDDERREACRKWLRAAITPDFLNAEDSLIAFVQAREQKAAAEALEKAALFATDETGSRFEGFRLAKRIRALVPPAR